MANSTVENLTNIASATPAGIQATDLLYIFRPGTPDVDFKADGDDIQSLVLGATLSVTAAGRALIDDTDAAAQRTTLGLGSIATQASNNISITGGSVTGITDLVVADGGTGASSFTANAILKGNGTGALIASGISIDSNDAISGFKSLLNAQTGTTYTLVAGDTGKTIRCTNASAITLTLPNSLAEGFTCEIIQGGAGQVTLSPASGAVINNRQSHTKIAGQYGAVRIVVVSNSGGTTATYNLAGDTGA